MMLVGCDLHARNQYVATLNTESGEVQERQLVHEGNAVEAFYGSLAGPVIVGVEATGHAVWFQRLLRQCGHTLLVGDSVKIRAMVVRRTKTDRRDALHLLELLKQDRFPAIWVPEPSERDLRALIAHRMRLVRTRTTMLHGLHAVALTHRVLGRSARLTRRRLLDLRALPLGPHMTRRRDETLELIAWLDTRINGLDRQLAEEADAHPAARRLLTHPGVGPLTALTTVLVLGPVRRFHGSKAVASYVGLAPAVNASADKSRLGPITKQGNPLLRYVLVQAGQSAARHESDLKRLYLAIARRRGHAKAKVAIARTLLTRLYIMLRDEIDYAEFHRRGRARMDMAGDPTAA